MNVYQKIQLGNRVLYKDEEYIVIGKNHDSRIVIICIIKANKNKEVMMLFNKDIEDLIILERR